MDRKEVLQYCGEALAKYKVPRLIEFRSELPKSAAGKIMRRTLAEEEGQKRTRRKRSGETEHEELLPAPEAEAEAAPSPNGSETE
jgi:long-chain acyl-CoA synthetase